MEPRTFETVCTVVSRHKLSALKATALSKAVEGFLMSNLAEACGCSPTAATQAVDDLEKIGHVVRTHQADDRRTIKVSITKDGRDMLNFMLKTVEKMLK